MLLDAAGITTAVTFAEPGDVDQAAVGGILALALALAMRVAPGSH
jgi:hypothetical protein